MCWISDYHHLIRSFIITDILFQLCGVTIIMFLRHIWGLVTVFKYVSLSVVTVSISCFYLIFYFYFYFYFSLYNHLTYYMGLVSDTNKCMCVCVCVYVCMCVCAYVRMYVCTYVRMYVCTYVCMYVCIYVEMGLSFEPNWIRLSFKFDTCTTRQW